MPVSSDIITKIMLTALVFILFRSFITLTITDSKYVLKLFQVSSITQI